MNPIPDLIERLKALVFRSRLERELDEELRFHLAREEAARAEAGSADPRRDALLAFGGVERVKDEVREARGVLPLDELVADLRYVVRALRRNLGFAMAVVAVLGIAIGAATAVFAVVDRVILSELPYPEPDRLVRIYQKNSPTNLWSLSAVDVLAIGGQQRGFAAFGAARYGSVTLTGAGSPARVAVGRVTSGFFQALGIRPAQGRLVESRDETPGANPVVVVSHRLAERGLGGPAAALGKAITIDGVSHTVVGVLEPGRNELAGIEAVAWPVLQLGTPSRRGPFGFRGIARLADGVSLAQATRDLAGISERIFPIWAAGFQDSVARLTPIPLRATVIGGANQPINLFAGAVGLVLLLAVANVATLMLVRASAREHELSVRTALGAGRHRLARLIVSECLMLTGIAGLVGLCLAGFGLDLVGVLAPGLPRLGEVRLGAGGVAFALAAAVASGGLISLATLWSVLARGSAAVPTLVASPGRAGSGRRAHAIRSGLVVAEFGLALPLLLGAGLLLRSFLRLERVDPGFDPSGVYALELSLPSERYPDNRRLLDFWRLAESRAAETDGVTAAGLAGSIPPDNYGDVNNFDLLDKPVPAGSSQPVAPWPSVTPGYFTALNIRLLEGRLFTPADSGTAPPVVVVSRAWAIKYYPDQSALGRQMVSGGCTSCPPTTVVGVVGDVHYRGLAAEGDAVYAPLAQEGAGALNLVVRSRLGAAATLRGLRAAIGALDPELAPVEVVMTDRLRDALGDPRRWTTVVGGFAAAGALLAALGVFGLMSYVVRQRYREMGVRLALGAAPGSLTRLVVQRGMRYALLGTVIGLGVWALLSRWIGALLFGVGAMDPATTIAAVAVLVAIAFIACWVPGRRAARIRPMESLSSD